MVWTLVFSSKAEKFLRKLDNQTEQIIIDRLSDILENPYKVLERLQQSQFYKLRIGKYRVIVDLRKNRLLVFVIKIDKRSKAYDVK